MTQYNWQLLVLKDGSDGDCREYEEVDLFKSKENAIQEAIIWFGPLEEIRQRCIINRIAEYDVKF